MAYKPFLFSLSSSFYSFFWGAFTIIIIIKVSFRKCTKKVFWLCVFPLIVL